MKLLKNGEITMGSDCLNKNNVLLAVILISAVFLLGCAAAEEAREDYSKMQIKLTYIGPQGKVVPTVVLYVNQLDMEKFRPHRREGIDYGNDEIVVNSFKVTEDEMKRIVENVYSLDFVKKEKKGDWVLSFMLYRETNNTVHEVMLDYDDSQNLLQVMKNSLDKNNTTGLAYLDISS